MNPWLELILGGVTLVFTYLYAIMVTGALTAKNIKDIKSITDRYKPAKSMLGPIYNQLLKIAKK